MRGKGSSPPSGALQVDEIKIKSTPFLERALPLARLGIRVFPCDVRGKEPLLLESGRRLSPLRRAVRFEEAIKAECTEYADCNVGCFFPSAAQNNFVVDIDSLSACEKILGHPLSLTGVAEVQSSTADIGVTSVSLAETSFSFPFSNPFVLLPIVKSFRNALCHSTILWQPACLFRKACRTAEPR